ncbi:MAG: hypothetical protein GXP19_07780 [Gammaproteobacteria bacterium]|nr:hypothetical protein [Gammaproteobacteria bacterium]
MKMATEINQSNDILEILSHILATISFLCGFVGIGMTFYLGRSKMKEIDQLVYGYKIPSDSIFFQLLRMPRYGGAFASRWGAKRAHLLHIRDQFDKKFQRPFIITHYLFIIGGISLVLLIILDKLFLDIT